MSVQCLVLKRKGVMGIYQPKADTQQQCDRAALLPNGEVSSFAASLPQALLMPPAAASAYDSVPG
jgi:hypothetical protein